MLHLEACDAEILELLKKLLTLVRMLRLVDVGVELDHDLVAAEALYGLSDLILREAALVRNDDVGCAGVKRLLDVLKALDVAA